MSEGENVMHVRLVAGSCSLQAFIQNLGYEPILNEGRNMDEITYYELKGKYLRMGFQGIILFYYIKGKYTEVYKGLTVHDELLTFFTKRDYDHDRIRISDLSLLPQRKTKRR